jgi:hypothetical protein
VLTRAFLNLLTSFLALAIFVLALEFIVFRFVLVPSDLPRLWAYQGGVLKFSPNQSGVYRIRDEIDAEFRINADGWNSRHPDYEALRKTGKPRICIIGDSYVEALQVPFTSSFSERLEDLLGDSVDSVYRFGLSGAPLSQYLYMLEQEVLQYHPQIVVINMVPNDFLESIVSGGGTYWSSFSTLQFEEGGIVKAKVPDVYSASASWWIKRSAIFRYFWVRYQIRPQALKEIWNGIFGTRSETTVYTGNISADSATDPRVPVIIDFVFSRFASVASENNLKIVLVIDADRSLIGAQTADSDSRSRTRLAPLYALVREFSEIYGLDLLDLTDLFVEDYRVHSIPMSFPHDGHWNRHAHRLVGEALGDFIREKYIQN